MKILFIDIPAGILQTNAFSSYLNAALYKRNQEVISDFLINKHGVRLPGNKTYSLGVLSLVTILKEKGYDITYKALDFRDENQILDEVCKYDVIMFSTKTTTYTKCVKLANRCKKMNSNMIVIFGGPHCSALPHEVVKESAIDFVCIGEGEETICELVWTIENKGNYEEIKGIAYKDNTGKVRINEERPLCQLLDKFPDPNLGLLEGDLNDYHVYIETGRGCFHNCSFCANPILWKRQVRRFTPERIYTKLKKISEKVYPNTLVHIVDPAFGVLDKDLELCKLLIDKPIPLKFSCDICAMDVKPETIETLYKAGVVMFCVGVEHCNNKVLNINKKPATFEKIINACKIIRQSCDALIKTYWIIGLPGETEETAKENHNNIIKMLRQKEIDICCEHIFVPYPGCDVYANPDKYNYHINHKAWELYDARTFPLPGEGATFSMENAYISYLNLLRAECEVLEGDKYYDRQAIFSEQTLLDFQEYKKNFI